MTEVQGLWLLASAYQEIFQRGHLSNNKRVCATGFLANQPTHIIYLFSKILETFTSCIPFQRGAEG